MRKDEAGVDGLVSTPDYPDSRAVISLFTFILNVIENQAGMVSPAAGIACSGRRLIGRRGDAEKGTQILSL